MAQCVVGTVPREATPVPVMEQRCPRQPGREAQWGSAPSLHICPDHGKTTILDLWAKGPQLPFSKFLHRMYKKEKEVAGKAGLRTSQGQGGPGVTPNTQVLGRGDGILLSLSKIIQQHSRKCFWTSVCHIGVKSYHPAPGQLLAPQGHPTPSTTWTGNTRPHRSSLELTGALARLRVYREAAFGNECFTTSNYFLQG